jgi:hypothetical protein
LAEGCDSVLTTAELESAEDRDVELGIRPVHDERFAAADDTCGSLDDLRVISQLLKLRVVWPRA